MPQVDAVGDDADRTEGAQGECPTGSRAREHHDGSDDDRYRQVKAQQPPRIQPERVASGEMHDREHTGDGEQPEYFYGSLAPPRGLVVPRLQGLPVSRAP